MLVSLYGLESIFLQQFAAHEQYKKRGHVHTRPPNYHDLFIYVRYRTHFIMAVCQELQASASVQTMLLAHAVGMPFSEAVSAKIATDCSPAIRPL